MIKIIVDGFGGDLSPQVNVEGSIKALNEIKDLEIILAGDEELLKAELNKYSYDKNRISILHAPDVITCHDKPTEAVKKKKESFFRTFRFFSRSFFQFIVSYTI